MNYKILLAILLLILGLIAFNNFFVIFSQIIFFEDRLIMLLTGVASIIASFIIFFQSILIRFHKAF
ncbi:MAG: hypothetical protein Q8R18_04770 [bacterium]|nr:hypothetical protein [bacterium]